jgi:hypothetical protein
MIPRRRRGSGCGPGCLFQVTASLALGAVLVLAISGIFMPWGFYLGGTFHLVTGWQGTATVRTATGDYALTIWMTPSGRSRLSGFPTFTGNGSLCTPRGERFRLSLYGVILARSGRDTDGKEMRIDLYHRPVFWSITGNMSGRPRLTLRGRWQNPDLVMNDGGTLSMAFLPDGRVYDGTPRNQPRARETVPVVFHYVPWSWSAPACAATH